MRDRLMMHAVWERCGIDREQITRMLFEIRQPGVNPFQAALFSKIVPNCKKLGLLDAGDGWLRERFTEIGVIEYEDAPDTEIEYALLDAVVPGPRSARARARAQRPVEQRQLRPRDRVGDPLEVRPPAGSRPHRATRGARCTTGRRTARHRLRADARPRATQRDLRRVTGAVEHRLAREETADGDAVEAADEMPASDVVVGLHTSMLCAQPSSCSRVYAATKDSSIHPWGRAGSAQPRMTSSNATSTVTTKRRADAPQRAVHDAARRAGARRAGRATTTRSGRRAPTRIGNSPRPVRREQRARHRDRRPHRRPPRPAARPRGPGDASAWAAGSIGVSARRQNRPCRVERVDGA